VFSTAFALNATAITLIGHMSLTLVVLRQPRFRVRGLLAETGLLVALGLFAVSVTVFLLDLVARSVKDPLVRGLTYALAASAPCAVLFAMQRYAPALESVLLNRLSPRRSHAQKLLQQLLASLKQALGTDELYKLTTTVLAELSASKVRFCHTGAGAASDGGERLPACFIRYWERSGDDVLSADQCQPSAEAWAELRADLLVPVWAEGELHGAFALRGGELDAHTLELAKAVAAQLGTKLAREALCERASQLEHRTH
jgi:GAF domain-containing protein